MLMSAKCCEWYEIMNNQFLADGPPFPALLHSLSCSCPDISSGCALHQRLFLNLLQQARIYTACAAS